ncbi:hypothetical protein D3C71_719190 [compost metagenome]
MILSLVKALLLFALLGPLVGLAGLFAQEPLAVAGTPWGELLLTVPLAYIFGIAPALAAGLSAWYLRAAKNRYFFATMVGVVGAVAASLFWLGLPQSPLPWTSIARLGAIPGGVAGLVCGLVYRWPPNNSFKPNPLRGSA